MKTLRPERFSDSEQITIPVLDRTMLEYHLSTLTSRSQETDFAKFALRLAEYEVCPNLLPQTGPTGGGDSKADAETYPVADSLSLLWYTGIGRDAANERWAFAFSAMKEWLPKLKSDVAKIAATGRGYTKAFFVTNQFVRDKARADAEDKLRVKHGLDVRILDRNWILDKVFNGRHEQLAIDELRLTISIRHESRKGPRDVQRQTELTTLEERIQEAARNNAYSQTTVDNCLEAAELARDIELPRVEVDGRFMRAERVAKQFGNNFQQLNCAYAIAWTLFNYHEDFAEFPARYLIVEKLASGSRNPYELELLNNLWYLLVAGVRQKMFGANIVDLNARSRHLEQDLNRLASDVNRPNAALQARTMRLMMKLLRDDDKSVALGDLMDVIDRSEGLVGFPLEKIAEKLVRLGEYLGSQPAYSKLFEKLIEVTSKRTSEITAARMLWLRGGQELSSGRPYEAISHLGRCLTRLHKHECRHDAVRALLLCGTAYARAGLLWAARGSGLAAAALAAGDYLTYSETTRLQADSYSFLRSLELRLGRVPQALAWHEVCLFTTRLIIEQGNEAQDILKEQFQFDGLLGIMFLNADFPLLRQVCRLPEVLGRHELDFATVALLFALGHEELLPSDIAEKSSGSRDISAFFCSWRDQLTLGELPTSMILGDTPMVELTSNVLGCRVTVECVNTSPCVELAESFVAALESFVATGHTERMIGREPILTIQVTKSDSSDAPFEYSFREQDGRPHFDLACKPFSPHSVTFEVLGQIRSRLLELITEVCSRVFLVDDVDQLFSKLIKDELAIDRSINFTGSFGTVGNVLGHSPKMSITAWSPPETHEYPLKREVVWDAVDRVKKLSLQTDVKKSAPQPGQGNPPEDILQLERLRHSEMRTVSLIREPLWNRAGWSGTAYLWHSDCEPPVMAWLFRDSQAAAKIFYHLHIDVGAEDSRDALRVSIIRGIDRHNPFSYRIVIGSNLDPSDSWPVKKTVFLLSRVHTMTPSSSFNLDNFLANYERSKSYALTYATIGATGNTPLIASRAPLIKNHLHVRDAWQIGLNDLDCSGIQPEDDPIIPPDQLNAPIIEVLKRAGKK
jgi:tetratricopeptide (TPR) repeat protein